LAVAPYDCVPTPYINAFKGDSGEAARLLVSSDTQCEGSVTNESGTLAQDIIDAMLSEPETSDANAPNLDTADTAGTCLEQGVIYSLFD